MPIDTKPASRAELRLAEIQADRQGTYPGTSLSDTRSESLPVEDDLAVAVSGVVEVASINRDKVRQIVESLRSLRELKTQTPEIRPGPLVDPNGRVVLGSSALTPDQVQQYLYDNPGSYIAG